MNTLTPEYKAIQKFYGRYPIGKGSLVKFKGDDKEYTVKNIGADIKKVFVTLNGLQTYAKDITKITHLQRKPIQFTMNEQVRTSPNFALTMEELVGLAMDNGLDLAPYEPSEVLKGLEVELEHGSENPKTDITHNDPLKTLKVVLAHLNENPSYYEVLQQARLEEKLVKRLESLTGKKVKLKESQDLQVIISNWSELRDSFNEFNASSPGKYMNCMEVYKDVVKQVRQSGVSPDHISVSYEKKWHGDAGEALFNKQSEQEGKVTYEYTGIIK